MAYNFEKLEELLKTKGVGQDEITDIIAPLRKMAEKRRYGLVWEEQEEDIEKSLKDRYTVLHEVTEREIKLDEGGRTHSLIEGDNLEALTFLKNSGKKVDVIYIDPPYNTGNKDFVYNDRYVDKEDSWRHSSWLSFMNKRLMLARDVMTDDGVIFISIDDNEMAQLKLLCDSIFGEHNLIANMIIDGTPKNDPLFIATSHEYCLVYTKDKNSAKKKDWGIVNGYASELKKLIKDVSSFNEAEEILRDYYKKNKLSKDNISNYKYVDERGIYRTGPIDDPQRKGPKDKRFNPVTKEEVKTPDRGWSCSLKTWEKWIEEGLVKFPEDNTKLCSKKTYLEEDKLNVLKSVVKHQTRKSSTTLKEMFGKKVFDHPKPIELVKELIKGCVDKNITILDFFAGSGTTAHAVLELNREDGGNRQVILCTNNENNIAEEVTYERIKRVMEGYTTPKGKSVEGIPGNLRYFKVDSVDADEDIYTLEDNLLEVVVPFIQFQEDAWSITTGKPGFTYLDDRVTIYNDPYHLDEDFLDHIKGNTFYIYDGWMDYLDIEELKDIRVVPIPKEFFKLFR